MAARGVKALSRGERNARWIEKHCRIPEGMKVGQPVKLTKEQRELFEKLAESLGTTVKPQEKGFLDWLNEALGG